MKYIFGTELKMTSREIADLTEKTHAHVIRDCNAMFEALDISPEGYIQHWIAPQNKQTYIQYLLSKELVLTLVTGYSIKLRNCVILKLMELEQDVQYLMNQHKELHEILDSVDLALSKAGRTLVTDGKKTKPMIKSKIKDIEEILQPDLFKLKKEK